MNGAPLCILLVEDNEDHAEVVRRSFKSHQVANDIHHVTNGQAALDYLFRRGDYSDHDTSPRPHVIVLDLRLPKVDGLEVLREIKQDDDLRRIPVVVLTSSQGERDVAMAYDHHANSYLVKPLDFKKFTELMRDLGFYWLAWNVHPFVDGDHE
ncbi:MAG: response regulator [Desulfomonile tiedjei]|nr:response regulator [Desulfomonile tiedjei]